MNIKFPLRLGITVEVKNDFYEKNNSWFLDEVSHFNFFIGPNNSGKSRLIRFLCKLGNEEIFFDDESNVSEKIKEKLVRLFPSGYIHHRFNHLTNADQIDLFEGLKDDETAINIKDIKDTVYKVSKLGINSKKSNDFSIFGNKIKERLDTFEFYGQLEELNKIEWQKTYIPVLRSLRPLGDEKAKDFYKSRTIVDYFEELNDELSYSKIDIFTGHSVYNDIQKSLLGSHEERTKIAKFEKFLSEKFFNYSPVTLIPKLNDDVISIRIGDEERDICSVGDGIQSIIIITFPAFMETQNRMFFIEEPEKFLHAGMQRVLIDTLSEFKQHIFFFTTHSNHFLDLASERNDLSIYKVQRKAEKTAIQNQKNFKNILDDLGVRASSVLLANSSIWVEGVTDHKYLRVYLRKYIESLGENAKSYLEDLHFTFFEYQGSNLEHWAFDDEYIDRENESKNQLLKASLVNSKIFLVADGDIRKDDERVKYLKQNLEENFFKIEQKEIENLIPAKYINQYANNYWNNSMKGKEGLSFSTNGLGERDYLSPDRSVGVILDECIQGVRANPKKVYFKDGITIHRKTAFCDDIIKLILNDWDNFELTPELNDLCKSIYEHIQRSNS